MPSSSTRQRPGRKRPTRRRALKKESEGALWRRRALAITSGLDVTDGPTCTLCLQQAREQTLAKLQGMSKSDLQGLLAKELEGNSRPIQLLTRRHCTCGKQARDDQHYADLAGAVRAAVAHNELPQATIIGGEQLVAELETMKLPELFPKAAAMGVSQAMIAASKQASCGRWLRRASEQAPHAQEMIATGTCARTIKP